MNSELLQTYDHYLYALVAMVGTGMGVIGLQWLMRYSRWAAWVRSLAGVAPPFINIIGVLFGLTLAFLANDTWSAHDRATNAVFREADALRSLVTLSASLPEPLQGRVRAAVVSYGQASAAEWPLLARRQSGAEVPQRADALLKLLASRDIASALPDTVHALMLRKVSDIQGERDQRIGLSQTHVNPLKWLGMAFLGLVTLLSLAVVHADNARAALVAMVLFALAAAPTAAIMLIQGNPFQRPAAVSRAPIEAAIHGLQVAVPVLLPVLELPGRKSQKGFLTTWAGLRSTTSGSFSSSCSALTTWPSSVCSSVASARPAWSRVSTTSPVSETRSMRFSISSAPMRMTSLSLA